MDLKILQDQIDSRRSVRKYCDEKITEENRTKIIDFCNEISDENFTFTPVFDEPGCFASKILTFGLFKNVKNYIVVKAKIPLVNQKLIDIGYNGALVLLFLKTLSYGSCWVAKTFSKNRCVSNLSGNEELVSVISFGKPLENNKSARKSKTLNEVASYLGESPDWFISGCKAALKAPTALNHQNFKIRGSDEGIELILTKESTYSLVSFGIVKRFFEIGAYPNEIKYK